jgi:hypothetical protein
MSWVQILRGVRLGSLTHGIPEAIPIWLGQPLFPKCSPARDPCQASVVWACDHRYMQSPMYTMTHDLWRLRSHTFDGTKAFVVEGVQLEHAVMDVATRLAQKNLDVTTSVQREEAGEVAGVEYQAALVQIGVALRAAIENGELVVIRKWIKVPDRDLPRTALPWPSA